MGAGTDTKAASAKLTANPRPAPLICCARQDQPSFKHWLPCAALRWSCAGGRCTASRLLCTHSRSPSSLPLFLTTYHHHHTPPHHHHQLRRPKSALVTRRPTSPPCDHRENCIFSPLRPSRSNHHHRGTVKLGLLLSAVARSHSFPAGIAYS